MEILLSNAQDVVPSKEDERYVIAKKTYHNIVSLVYGFIGYARQILNDTGDKEYVPALHCDQSSIEGLFSHVRANGKDRADLYGIGIM